MTIVTCSDTGLPKRKQEIDTRKVDHEIIDHRAIWVVQRSVAKFFTDFRERQIWRHTKSRKNLAEMG